MTTARAWAICSKPPKKPSALRTGRNGAIWTRIIGMRNRLVHGYDQVDLEVLWQTLSQDLQPLIDELKKILPAGGTD